MRRDSTIRDISLAPEGERKIQWVAQHAVNIAASDGHPVEIMDMSFSVQMLSIHHPVEIMDLSFTVQALAIHYLARHHRELAPGVHPLPAEIDREIAGIKLETLGVSIDSLTAEQVEIRRRWQ